MKLTSIFLTTLTLGLLISCRNPIGQPEVPVQPEITTGKIIVNPYGKTPLSAVYRLPRINQKEITVTVKGLYGENDISHTYSAGYGLEFAIHGYYIPVRRILLL